MALAFCAVMVLSLFAACSGEKPAASPSSAADSTASPSPGDAVSAISEKYPAGSKLELTYAKNFSIEYLEDGMKLVTDGEGTQLLLLQTGQTAPVQYASLKMKKNH